MSYQHPPCAPSFRPSPGDEDHHRLSRTAGRVFYVVGLGYSTGIYTDEYIARKQVSGFLNGQWKKAFTYDEAIAIWNRMCERYHQHDDHDSQGSLVPESPHPSPPSPSPSPSPLRLPAAYRHTSLPPLSVGRKATYAASCQMAVPSPSKPSTAVPSSSKPSTVVKQTEIRVVSSTRHVGQWRTGDTLWGVEGQPFLFEDRYDMVDHVYAQRLSPVRVMETCNRRCLEAFVELRGYVRRDGDPEDSD
ncbi:hypothetical protein B0H14DRAFT_3503880 [Mycena olivaceomarginata]|nr:hypothetical protein B0H14DRAFT_3503880 [Mycena olivaceomarginata]